MKLLWCSALFLFSNQASAAVYKIYAAEVPSLVERQGSGVEGLSGLFGTIVKERIIKSGKVADFEVVWVPWKRALNETLTEKNALFFPLARTPEREKSYQWLGHLGAVESWFYASNPAVQINSLEDIKKYRVGFMNGSMRDQELHKIVGINESHLDGMTEDVGNYKKLVTGRIDVWTTQTMVFEKTEQEYRKLHPHSPKVRAVKKFLDQDIWLVTSKNMDDKLQEQIRKIFKSDRKAPEFNKVSDSLALLGRPRRQEIK